MEEFILGVDEAGRGPWRGRGGGHSGRWACRLDVLREFPGVKDSKLLSGQKREKIFEEVQKRVRCGDLRVCVRLSSQSYIDRFGITRAVRKAVWGGVRSLAVPDGAIVLLDGLLRAPKEYNAAHYYEGDFRVPVIALASIMAKVTRDRLMERLSPITPSTG